MALLSAHGGGYESRLGELTEENSSAIPEDNIGEAQTASDNDEEENRIRLSLFRTENGT